MVGGWIDAKPRARRFCVGRDRLVSEYHAFRVTSAAASHHDKRVARFDGSAAIELGFAALVDERRGRHRTKQTLHSRCRQSAINSQHGVAGIPCPLKLRNELVTAGQRQSDETIHERDASEERSK
jgi:hypothetical protein